MNSGIKKDDGGKKPNKGGYEDERRGTKEYKELMHVIEKQIINEGTYEEIFGYKIQHGEGQMLNDIMYADAGDPKTRGDAYLELKYLLDARNYDDLDKKYDEYSEKFGVTQKLEDKKIIAQAYNDYMEKQMSIKNQPVYRYISDKEVISLLDKKEFTSSKQSRKESEIDEGAGSTAYKSFTINKDHIFKNIHRNHIEDNYDDYDFHVMKAVPYPRKTKSVKFGMPIYAKNLKEYELRMKTDTKIVSNTKVILKGGINGLVEKYEFETNKDGGELELKALAKKNSIEIWIDGGKTRWA